MRSLLIPSESFVQLKTQPLNVQQCVTMLKALMMKWNSDLTGEGCAFASIRLESVSSIKYGA